MDGRAWRATLLLLGVALGCAAVLHLILLVLRGRY